MVNLEKLREAMAKRAVTPEAAAETLGIDRSTFYRRLERNGAKFTVEEVANLSRLLKLSAREVNAIFFEE